MQQHLSKAEIEDLPSRYRAQLINSLSGFKSASLLATQDQSGRTNLAVISSVFHIGASPALVGMIIRPDTVTRDSLNNLKHTQSYTLNHVNSAIWQRAHQTSARYASEVSEFEEVGLTPEYTAGVTAPFVRESHLKYALEPRQIQRLEINGTLLVIGEITYLTVLKECIQPDGYIDIESLDTLAISGLDSYHTTSRLGRLSYAKPNEPLQELNADGSVATQ